jgi:hypothetical protein
MNIKDIISRVAKKTRSDPRTVRLLILERDGLVTAYRPDNKRRVKPRDYATSETFFSFI